MIVYPQDSESALVFLIHGSTLWPGRPAAIRDKFFAKHVISPKAGDFYIFSWVRFSSTLYVVDGRAMAGFLAGRESRQVYRETSSAARPDTSASSAT